MGIIPRPLCTSISKQDDHITHALMNSHVFSLFLPQSKGDTPNFMRSKIYKKLNHVPSPSVSHNDAIVNGEGIGGETSYIPGPDLDWFTQRPAETVVMATRYLQRLHQKS